MSEMGGDVSAGRLVLDAYADTTGLARGLQRRIDAETKAIRAKIKAEIDTRGIKTQMQRAAKEAAAGAAAKVQVKFDGRQIKRDLQAALDAARQDILVTVKVKVDQGSLTQAQTDIKRATGDTTVETQVDADTAAAEAQIEGMRARQSRPVNVPVNVGGASGLTSLGATVMQLSKIPAMVGGIYTLGVAAVQAAGGLVAMASAASQAAGALAVLPNLAGMAVQGVGALVLGFSGIGDAVGELASADAAAAADTEAFAQAQTGAARQVADAQRALREARHSAADAARSSASAIENAEYNLARAQEASQEAQEGLNEARQAARDRIRDLNTELRLTANDEAAAMARLTKAREDLQDVRWDKASSEQERRDARIEVLEAEGNLERVRARRADLADETAAANKAGVKGSDEVVAARERIEDTARSEQQAEKALQETRHQAADTARHSAQAIASAQRALADAQRAATDAATEQSTAQANLATAMDKLSPAGQRFARFIFSLKPRWDELKQAVQTSLLPPIQTGIERALPFLDTLQTGLVDTGARIGNLGKRLGTLMGGEEFNTNSASIMDENNRALSRFGRAGINLIEILQDVAVVAGPTLLRPFSKWVEKLTEGWKETVNTSRKTGKLRDMLRTAGDRAAQLGDIIGNLTGALWGMGDAASGPGGDLLDTFTKTTQRWSDWANSDAGQDRMEQFFESTKPVTEELGRLVANLSEFLIKAGEGGGTPLTALLKTLNTLLDGLNWAMSQPGLSELIGGLMMLAGVGGGLGLVAGGILKMAKGFGKLGKVTGLSKLIGGIRGAKDAIDDELPADEAKAEAVDGIGKRALATAKRLGKAFVGAVVSSTKALGRGAKAAAGFVLQMLRMAGQALLATARIVAHTAAMVAQRIAMFAVAAATKAWAIAQRLLNLAMRANPIGLIITLLIAFGVAIWQLYKRNEKFRALVNKVWGAIKKAIGWAWDKVIKPAFNGIKDGLKTLGKWAKWLWEKAIQPAWKMIRLALQTVWRFYYKPILKLLGTALQTLGDVFKWLWNKAIKPSWDKIKDAIKWSWDHVFKPVFSKLRDFIKTTIPNAFETGVAAIKKIWDTLKTIASKPVEFMVNTVYNKGIRKMVNAIPGVPNLDELEFKGFARGGVLPGYTPGKDVHRFYSPTGGGLALAGGEGIAVPQVVRAIGKRGWDALNEAGRRGVGAARDALAALVDKGHHFARGGIVYVDGEPMSRVAAAQLAVAEKASGIPMSIMQGSYQPQTSYSGTSHMGGGVMDTAPGTFSAQAWLRKVAFAAWARNIPGAGYAGSGAHVHSVSRIDPAAAGHAQLSSFARGEDGLGHADTGPNPPLVPSLIAQVRSLAGAPLSMISAASGGGGGGGNVFSKFIDALGAAKDFITNIPDWFGKLREMGRSGWGGMMIDAVKSIGSDLRDWINDKLPGSPIPNIFDTGGAWPTGTLGMNLSGATETVFTNREIVDLSGDLATLSRNLRAMTTDRANGDDRLPALVEHLTLQGRPEDMPNLLADANHELRRIRRGGVHAKRT